MKKLFTSLLLVACAVCSAETYRFIVPTPPGGQLDSYSRVLQRAAGELGHEVIIINQPGADGNIATRKMAQEPQRENTILISSSSYFIDRALEDEQYRKSVLALTPVTSLGRGTLLIVAKQGTKFATWNQLAKSIETNEQINVAMPSKLGTIIFNTVLGDRKNMNFVPFNGDVQSLNAALSGVVDVSVMTYSTAKSHIAAGTVVALASTAENDVGAVDLQQLYNRKVIPNYMLAAFIPGDSTPEKRAEIKKFFDSVLATQVVKDFRKQNMIVQSSITLEKALRELQ